MYLVSLIILGNVFKENWHSFDNWVPEVAATGGGNEEFQQYYLHPETGHLVNNTLQIHPRFVETDLRQDLDLYALGCTNNWNNGCYSRGSMHWSHGTLHYENGVPIPVGGQRAKPFRSVKLVSKMGFGYGLLKVKFKLPKGNYLWPAIWMLPYTNVPWPTGGEIDLVESMGNSPGSGYGLDYSSVSSALHFGYNESFYGIAYSPFAEKVQEESFNRFNLDDDWHEVTLFRTKYNMIISIDNHETLNCDKMFRAAASKSNKNAPYRDEVLNNGYLAGFRKYTKMMGKSIPDFMWKDDAYNAPFNGKFKLIVNLAVGGNFFGDSMNAGPNDVVPPWNGIAEGSHPAVQFLKRMDEWYNWGDEEYKEETNNVATLDWKRCITDEILCDFNKKYYLDSEKHLSYKKPKISDKTTFHIGEIKFIEFNN